MWFLGLFTSALSLVLVLLSVFPGMQEQIPHRPALIAGAICALFALFGVTWHLVAARRAGRRPQRVSVAVTLAALVITPLLVATYTPRSLVFQMYQSKFEALLSQAPPAGDHAVTPLNADLEPFWIDQWGTDQRGGIYFRTQGGLHDSFGFAYQPNAEGSPFGDSRYELHHLTGPWYSFAVSDE